MPVLLTRQTGILVRYWLPRRTGCPGACFDRRWDDRELGTAWPWCFYYTPSGGGSQGRVHSLGAL